LGINLIQKVGIDIIYSKQQVWVGETQMSVYTRVHPHTPVYISITQENIPTTRFTVEKNLGGGINNPYPEKVIH
jgi:hypothetical protein